MRCRLRQIPPSPRLGGAGTVRHASAFGPPRQPGTSEPPRGRSQSVTALCGRGRVAQDHTRENISPLGRRVCRFRLLSFDLQVEGDGEGADGGTFSALEAVTFQTSGTLYSYKRTGFAIFGIGWLPRPDFFVYADVACVTVHPYLSSPGVHEYDPDPVCHQERLSQ